MGELYYEINSSYPRLRNPCITLFLMNAHKVSKGCVEDGASQERHFCYRLKFCPGGRLLSSK